MIAMVAGAATVAVGGPASAAPAAPAAKSVQSVLPAQAAIAAVTDPVSPTGGPQNIDDVNRYLDDPRMLGEGQQAPHVDLRPYGDARTAAGDITEHSARSPHVASLNGDWRLRLFDRPGDVPAEFHSANFDAASWPTASVPHTWQSDFIDHPMFRNIPEELWPDNPPFAPKDVNPTGAYVRTMDLPADWAGDRTFLRFEGVTSGYFLWVNGSYAGYDQGGYLPAEFDITSLVKPGRNQIAVQVHRWSAGSYLEDYDQWRYSGIFRDVWMYRTEQTRLQDAYITTDLDATYTDATLSARIDVARAAEGTTGAHTVRGTLRDARGGTVTTMNGPVELAADSPGARVTLTAPITNPAKWSADEPNLYSLVIELLGPDGAVLHTASQPVGFREIEVRDRQVMVNGARIMVKGTNRAETDPDTGRYNTRERQRSDVFLMKRLHLNAVRTSHYPSDPYLYDLANKHGLWVDDEMEIETHAHENCPDECLAEREEWQDAFADRFQGMVARDKNHPSIIMWDTGNEAGLGRAHNAMAEWADANEPTRLLYHQSNNPNGDAPFADVSGPRYWNPNSIRGMGDWTTKPVIMGEYAHAMGNGLGNFDQFWDVVRTSLPIQGGFIWDWAEQDLRQPLILTPDTSPNRIQTFLVGKPLEVPGHRGQAVNLTSLDDFVDVFRDRRLDISGNAITLDAWVRPGAWAGSFPIVTKGQAYGLQMTNETTLEFGVTAGGARSAVTATVPANWQDNWHRVTGVYDGAALRLLIDGAEVATAEKTGAIDPGVWEVNIGRNAQIQRDNYWGARLARGHFDDVRIYPTALSTADLAGDPADRAALALNFDTFERRGDFLSLGLSISGTDGLVGSDRYVQPETNEMAWAHAPVRFTAVDAVNGRFRVHNEQAAGTFELRLKWNVIEQERTIRSGSRHIRLAAGQTMELNLGAVPANPNDRERFYNLSVENTRDTAWARRGWVMGYDQFSVGGRSVAGILPGPPPAGAPALARDGAAITVSGRDWTYRFNGGDLASMRVDGRELLHAGPRLDIYRPPTSNETYDWGTADREIWHDLGIDRLQTTVTGVDTRTEGDETVVEVRSTVAAPGLEALFSVAQTIRYRIDARGTITLVHDVVPSGSRASSLPYLPRVGIQLQVPDEMQEFAWYGRGPEESYNDRRSGSPMGVYRSTVEEEYVRYSRPQAYGNHTDTRWATLSDGRRSGLLVGGNLNVSVTPYDDLDRAEYDHQLPLVRNNGWVTLHTGGGGETGMGETPNSVLAPFAVSATRPHHYEMVLRPLTRAEIRNDGVINSNIAAPCRPDVTATTDGDLAPGTPETVEVTVSARCAAGLTDVRAALAVPTDWVVTPETVEIGTVAAGTPARATFTVTAPAGTDFGTFEMTATVTSASSGFRTTESATTSVRTPLPAGAQWVSDLPFVSSTNGWGPVEKDMSNAEQPAGDGRPITLGGAIYPKGIGGHAVSSVVIDLPAGCTSFRSDVGVDDETGSSGSVGFEVWIDGERRAQSGVLTGAASAQAITVDVTGGRQMELRMTDGGDGVGSDHGDWAGARLFCTG